jgi:hypothetical protein
MSFAFNHGERPGHELLVHEYTVPSLRHRQPFEFTDVTLPYALLSLSRCDTAHSFSSE